MAEGKYEISGAVAIEEERKELVAAHRSTNLLNQSCGKEGADTIETNAKCCQYVRPSDYSFVNKTLQESRNTQSNMIITSGATRSNLNIFVATCAANLASVAAGCVLTWTSPTLPKLNLSPLEKACITSLTPLGAAFGPFIASFIVNKLGRKWTIIADMFLFLISWSALAYCREIIYCLYFARFLAGIAVGIVFTVVPMYVAEISPLHLRGALGSLMQFFLCMGFLIPFTYGPGASYRELIAVAAAVPLMCALIFAWVPESPYHLLNKNKKQEALESLQWLRGYPERILMQSEITDILAAADEARHNKGSLKTLFSNKGYLKALYYACALAFFQQMSGINVVLFNAQSILVSSAKDKTPEENKREAANAAILIGAVMAVAAGLTAPIAKLWGIRKLLCFSAVGEAISLGTLGLYYYLENHNTGVDAISWLPKASLVSFIIVYSLGFGPFVWVIMAEIFSANLKSISSALTASFCWFLSFLLTLTFALLPSKSGFEYVFWTFSMFCVLSLLFVVFQLPNTEGKSYQEIQEMITGKKKSDFSDVKA